MQFQKRILSICLIVFLTFMLVACNNTNYLTTCTKDETEIRFTYNDSKVLSYYATNEIGVLEQKDILGDIDWMLAIIGTAEKFGGICTTNVIE